MAKPDFNPAEIVYSPQEIFTIGTDYLDYRRKHQEIGIRVGLRTLDEPDERGNLFLPALPGELISIIARPGNGKTGFMMRWARWRAKQLQEAGELNRVVVYATWEQSIEELHAFNVAAEARLSVTNMARGAISESEWDEIMAAGVQRVNLPLWFIGHSMKRRKARPNLTVSALAGGLDYIEKWDNERLTIDMVFVDYLQRVKFDGKVESKTIGTSEILDRLKDGALAFGCPFVVGVQATRDVDERKLPIPQMDDGQWTSNIEQSSDGILSLVRPRKYREEGELFGEMVVKGHTQMLVTTLKRKLGPDNFSKWVYFEPEYNHLDELEVRHVDLNKEL